MRITIVSGFFLPVPPVRGGSTEKSWYHLARHFAAQGHVVTQISRRWPGWQHEEVVDGIRYLRLPGADHRRWTWLNLLLDFLWSWRVFFALPPADIVVVNTVTLPLWLGRLKPGAGQVVLMTGRMPKGQYRHYGRIARVLAASTFVRTRVLAENPQLDAVMRVCGYPIDWTKLSRREDSNPATPVTSHGAVVTLGYVGRLHEEKGLTLLVAAMKILSREPDLPPWRLVLCGPADIALGGSGTVFKNQLVDQLSQCLRPSTFSLMDPQFIDGSLVKIYQSIGIFIYPSLAEKGETFGVAVAEAMAAGAVPVVSGLSCFQDLVRDGENGMIFDHQAPDAAARLAASLLRLLRDTALRQQLSAAAQSSSQRYDYPDYAANLLADFAQLTGPAVPASSPP